MTIQYEESSVARSIRGSVPERWQQHPCLTRIERIMALSDDDRRSLWRLIEAEITVRKHSEVVVDGYEYRKLCFVQEGCAARQKLLRNGKRQIISFHLPGDIIGMPASFLERPGYSVIALTELKLQVCSLAAYVELCCRRPQFGLVLSWLAMQEVATCAEHVINNGRRTPPERLAHFLLEIHARLATIGRASKTSFDLPFSQEVMSDALGLSVPHLNRTLAKLRSDGLIVIRGRQVELIDRAALELLGHFQPLDLIRVPVATAIRVA